MLLPLWTLTILPSFNRYHYAIIRSRIFTILVMFQYLKTCGFRHKWIIEDGKKERQPYSMSYFYNELCNGQFLLLLQAEGVFAKL